MYEWKLILGLHIAIFGMQTACIFHAPCGPVLEYH
jgi:hypothetical protein